MSKTFSAASSARPRRLRSLILLFLVLLLLFFTFSSGGSGSGDKLVQETNSNEVKIQKSSKWVQLKQKVIGGLDAAARGTAAAKAGHDHADNASAAVATIYDETWYKPGWSYDRDEICSTEKQSKLSNDKVESAKRDWKSFLESIEPRIPKLPVHLVDGTMAKPSRGIVFTGHSGILKQFIRSVLVLRHHGCKLPVEFWHFGEISEKEAAFVAEKLDGVTVRDMKLVKDSPFALEKDNNRRMWEMKGASLIHSSFEQVLFMDTDNIVARDPTPLFDSQVFQETGALFWKDFGKLGRDNAIWSILEIPCTTEFEQEAGQLLVDKTRPDTLRSLYLAAYMQQQRDLYFELFWGDKETFRLAWRALKAPYHMIRPHLAAVGVKKPQIDKFCGHTMVQYSPMWIPSIYGPAPKGWTDPSRPEIMFMHANLFKYDHVQEDGIHFKTLMYYRHPEARKNEGGAFDSKHGLCTDMRTYTEDNGLVNEIVVEDLAGHLPNFEQECKKYESEAVALMGQI